MRRPLCALLTAARRLALPRRRLLDASPERFHEVNNIATRWSYFRIASDDLVTLELLPHELLERGSVVIRKLIGIEGFRLLLDQLHGKVDHLLVGLRRGHDVEVGG